ncbi:hypothetical protein KC19_2G068300 [Ceratodon purpureus]|uniref:Uncharacterized protein n=1 Tax=Ceratodon purpureus TaxID=3225 RepID=A0A8T0ISQ4_CERPU|nr:hypothetical protein KC19_2G068300 [Ceratodon purpureus]
MDLTEYFGVHEPSSLGIFDEFEFEGVENMDKSALHVSGFSFRAGTGHPWNVRKFTMQYHTEGFALQGCRIVSSCVVPHQDDLCVNYTAQQSKDSISSIFFGHMATFKIPLGFVGICCRHVNLLSVHLK